MNSVCSELAEEGVQTVGLIGILSAARPEWLYVAVAFLAAGASHSLAYFEHMC